MLRSRLSRLLAAHAEDKEVMRQERETWLARETALQQEIADRDVQFTAAVNEHGGATGSIWADDHDDHETPLADARADLSERLESLFDRLDTGRTGRIGASEMPQVVAMLNEDPAWRWKLKPEEAWCLFDSIRDYDNPAATSVTKAQFVAGVWETDSGFEDCPRHLQPWKSRGLH